MFLTINNDYNQITKIENMELLISIFKNQNGGLYSHNASIFILSLMSEALMLERKGFDIREKTTSIPHHSKGAFAFIQSRTAQYKKILNELSDNSLFDISYEEFTNEKGHAKIKYTWNVKPNRITAFFGLTKSDSSFTLLSLKALKETTTQTQNLLFAIIASNSLNNDKYVKVSNIQKLFSMNMEAKTAFINAQTAIRRSLKKLNITHEYNHEQNAYDINISSSVVVEKNKEYETMNVKWLSSYNRIEATPYREIYRKEKAEEKKAAESAKKPMKLNEASKQSKDSLNAMSDEGTAGSMSEQERAEKGFNFKDCYDLKLVKKKKY
ncbi:hypothetical protein [Vibrio parahaemolyticus]|uniref:hypothetical protein n=1 Tax=Vibrio parahaemolyticus TaxID=670 RepID=UPI00111DD377|nr:hypothetical protein [Vibrio parahaemolyticus]TNZ94612.1 hypothetical protein CGK37_06170 [Vibrio parahaemolyticus]